MYVWLQEKICRQDRVDKKKIYGRKKFLLIYECLSGPDDIKKKYSLLPVSTYRIFRHLIIKPSTGDSLIHVHVIQSPND
jgi:hypothetical protein